MADDQQTGIASPGNSGERRLEQVLVFVAGVLFLATFCARLMYCELDHGDPFADADALQAGLNFAREGFVSLQFLPRLDVNGTAESLPYLTAPPGGHLLCGVVYRLVGQTAGLHWLRLIPLLSAIAGGVAWWWLILLLTGDRVAAALSTCLYAASPMFIDFADSAFGLSIGDSCRNICLLLWILYLRAGQPSRRRWLFAALFCAYATGTLFSLEYVAYLGVFMFAHCIYLVWRRKLRIPAAISILAVLAAAPLTVLFLHFLQDVWYFGSVSPLIQHLQAKLHERTMGWDEVSRKLTLYNWLHHGLIEHLRRSFALPLIYPFAICLATIWSLPRKPPSGEGDRRPDLLPLVPFALLLGGAACTWFLIFPGHSLSHVGIGFLGRLFLPFTTVVMTLGLMGLYRNLLVNKSRPALSLSWLVLVATTILMLLASSSFVRERGIHATDERFANVRAMLREIRENIKPSTTIGTNYYRSPPWEFYLQHPIAWYGSPKRLEQAAKQPDLFLLVAKDGYTILAFREVLPAMGYQAVIECRGWNRPIYVFSRHPSPGY